LLPGQHQGGILPGNPFNGGANAVAFSPDGHLPATARHDGYLRLRNPVTAQDPAVPAEMLNGAAPCALPRTISAMASASDAFKR
jgi:hypothetical protein